MLRWAKTGQLIAALNMNTKLSIQKYLKQYNKSYLWFLSNSSKEKKYDYFIYSSHVHSRQKILFLQVVQAGDDFVHVSWLEPLGLNTGCDHENALRQYANTAVSSHNGVRWAPHEATGTSNAMDFWM